MSAGCEIINSNVITVNGGNGAYGGHMISCSFNFGTLSAQGHRANVTLEGKNLGTPKIGESISITVLGSTFLFDIASYSKSSSARSMTTMSLNCVDISHRVLDNVHIILDEENEYTGGDVYKLGKKMLAIPDFVGPYMFPKPTTEWGSVTNVFPDLDPLVAPGKTRYGVKEDGLGGQTLDGVIQGIIEMPSLVDISNIPLDFEGSLRNIITNLALQVGIVPVYDMTSNSIKVLPSTGDDDGSSFNLAAGVEKLEKIGGKCLVVSATEQEDFTSTEAQGAIGKTEFSPSGNSGGPKGGRDKGGKTTRYKKAFLLNPDFHYGVCGGLKKMVLPFDDKNTLDTTKIHPKTLELEQALGCAFNPKVWALFVLQSVLNKVDSDVPEIKYDLPIIGQNPAEKETNVKIGEGLQTWPTAFNKNDFVADYYMNGMTPCGMKKGFKAQAEETDFVRAVIMNTELEIEIDENENLPGGEPNPNKGSPTESQGEANENYFIKEFCKIAYHWNKKPNALPSVLTGALRQVIAQKNPGARFPNMVNEGIAFEDAYMVLHRAGQFSSILTFNGELDGESDYFRKYLMAVANFKLKYFVIEGKLSKKVQYFYPDGKGGYYAVDTWKSLPTYNGMMFTTEGSLGASNITAPDGYEHLPLNPYRPLSTCDELLGLAKACYWMYVGNTPQEKCMDDFFAKRSVGKFVTALKENTLAEFFVFSQPETDLQTKEDEEDLKKAGQLWQINLMKAVAPANSSNAEAAFKPTETTCNKRENQPPGAAGETNTESTAGAAIAMTNMWCDLGGKFNTEGSTVSKAFSPKELTPNQGGIEVKKEGGQVVGFKNNIKEEGQGFNLFAIQNGVSMSDVVPSVQIRDNEVSGLMCIIQQKHKIVKTYKTGRDKNGNPIRVIASEKKVPIPGKAGEEKRCFIKCWYDHEQDPPAVGEGGSIGPTNRYVINSHSPIPATWPKVWKTNLQKGFSVSPADFEWEKHKDEEDGSTDYSYEGSEYNTKIIARTKVGLDEIVQANTWVDSIPAKSKSITIIADESLDFGSLPGVTEGLQSLDVSLSGDKTTISITIGNTNYKQQMKMIRDANIKALEAGHRSSTLHKEKQLENLKAEKIFNIG